MVLKVDELAKLDLEAQMQPTVYGDAVVLHDVDLGPEFAPSTCAVQFWRMGRSVGVRIPEAVQYIGADQRLQKGQVMEGWRLLHVGPAKLAECAREFSVVLEMARGAPSVLPERRTRKK